MSPVALGCWPIAGITSVEVNQQDSLATLQACFDLGVNFLDAAYMYGYAGESEKMIARAIGDRRDEMVIATKCGLHWSRDRRREPDGRPATILSECEESLRRLNTDHVELFYLHDPPARRHGRCVWRQAAVSDSRKRRRWDGLEADLAATGYHPQGAGRPRHTHHRV